MSRRSFERPVGSSALESLDWGSGTPYDSSNGTTAIHHEYGDRNRGQLCFAAELGSAIEETVASVVARHGGSGVDGGLAWEAIQNLAASKLDRSTGASLSPRNLNHSATLYNNSISGLGSSITGPLTGNYLDPYASHPVMRDLDPFFPHEHFNNSGNVPNFDLPELGNGFYHDGPFSLSQIPIPSPSSGTISLPANSPSIQESRFDVTPVNSSTPGSSYSTVAAQSTPRSCPGPSNPLPMHQKDRLSVPQPRHRSQRRQGVAKSKAKQKKSRICPHGYPRISNFNNSNLCHDIRGSAIQEALTSPAVIQNRRGRPSDRPSCARCKIRKKGCSGDGERCDACNASPLYRELCIPVDFKESRSLLHILYQTRIHDLSNNVEEWLPIGSYSPRTIEISNGFMPSLKVALRPYTPFSTSKLTHILFRGTEAGSVTPTAESTAFALELETLTSQKIDEYCDSLAFDLALSEGQNVAGRGGLARYILMFAATQCGVLEGEPALSGIHLVKLALRFWAMQAVFFKYPWTIVRGASQIGMSPLSIPGCWYGKTLLPRLVNQELDRDFEIRMDELEREILEELQELIFSRERNSYWCAIFLTIFILLHSLEKDSWNMHAWEFERDRIGGTRWPLQRHPFDYYQQNKHIADTLTRYFHVVTNGHAPFVIDWTKASNKGLLNQNPAALRLIEGIQRDLQGPQSIYGRELNAPNVFRRDDVECLNYSYTKRLILG